jgi:hypothetical protein
MAEQRNPTPQGSQIVHLLANGEYDDESKQILMRNAQQEIDRMPGGVAAVIAEIEAMPDSETRDRALRGLERTLQYAAGDFGNDEDDEDPLFDDEEFRAAMDDEMDEDDSYPSGVVGAVAGNHGNVFAPAEDFQAAHEIPELPQSFVRRLSPQGWSRKHLVLLWCGIDPATRAIYETAACSYEQWCAGRGQTTPWPVSLEALTEWVRARAYGPYPFAGSTLQDDFDGLRSAQVDLHFPTDVFDFEAIWNSVQRCS